MVSEMQIGYSRYNGPSFDWQESGFDLVYDECGSTGIIFDKRLMCYNLDLVNCDEYKDNIFRTAAVFRFGQKRVLVQSVYISSIVTIG